VVEVILHPPVILVNVLGAQLRLVGLAFVAELDGDNPLGDRFVAFMGLIAGG
jgi:hypothetical protein